MPDAATPPVTWPTTVSSAPTPASDNCVLPTLKHSLSVGRAAVLKTGPLPPPDHKSGTVCRPISDYVAVSSGGYWRHFYSDSDDTAQCELFLTAPNRNVLTYLLHTLAKTNSVSTVRANSLRAQTAASEMKYSCRFCVKRLWITNTLP